MLKRLLFGLTLSSAISPLAVASLDVGEAAVIQLAIKQNIKTVCIDERTGRRAALAVGLKVVGSLGLLGKAKTLGLISEVRPFIEKAKSGGIFYDDNLIESFLRSCFKTQDIRSIDYQFINLNKISCEQKISD